MHGPAAELLMVYGVRSHDQGSCRRGELLDTPQLVALAGGPLEAAVVLCIC